MVENRKTNLYWIFYPFGTILIQFLYWNLCLKSDRFLEGFNVMIMLIAPLLQLPSGTTDVKDLPKTYNGACHGNRVYPNDFVSYSYRFDSGPFREGEWGLFDSWLKKCLDIPEFVGFFSTWIWIRECKEGVCIYVCTRPWPKYVISQGDNLPYSSVRNTQDDMSWGSKMEW